jgi:hypothetical protein
MHHTLQVHRSQPYPASCIEGNHHVAYPQDPYLLCLAWLFWLQRFDFYLYLWFLQTVFMPASGLACYWSPGIFHCLGRAPCFSTGLTQCSFTPALPVLPVPKPTGVYMWEAKRQSVSRGGQECLWSRLDIRWGPQKDKVPIHPRQSRQEMWWSAA